MHDDLILVIRRICGDVYDLIDDILIGGSSVEETQSVEGTSIGVIIGDCVVSRSWQEFGNWLFVFEILEDQTQRSNGGEFSPMRAFACPGQVFLLLNKRVILCKGLQKGKTHNGTSMGNRILGLNLFQHCLVVGVGLGQVLKDSIVNLVGDFPIDDVF